MEEKPQKISIFTNNEQLIPELEPLLNKSYEIFRDIFNNNSKKLKYRDIKNIMLYAVNDMFANMHGNVPCGNDGFRISVSIKEKLLPTIYEFIDKNYNPVEIQALLTEEIYGITAGYVYDRRFEEKPAKKKLMKNKIIHDVGPEPEE